MKDDLHDIDDLFKNGIEGYTEEVPAAVWDAVDNDLNKKQASLYKNKYYHIKRFTLLLLLLCIISGVYIIINSINDKQADLSRQKNIALAPLLNGHKEYPAKNTELEAGNIKPAVPIISEHDSSEPATGEINNTQKNKEQKDNIPTDESADYKVKNQVRKPANGIMANGTLEGISVGNYLNNKENTHQLITNKKYKDIAAQDNEATNTYHYLPPQTVRLHLDTDLANYITPKINLLTLPANHKYILPQSNKVITKQTRVKNNHEISLSVFGAPNFNFDRLEDDHHLAEPGRNREEAHKKEQGSTSFSAGLLVNYTLNKKLSIQSGAAITYSSIAIAPKTIYAKPNNGQINFELNCSSGNAYIMPKSGPRLSVGDSANTFGTISKLTYITIPASINYRIGIGNLSLLPTLGTGFNILLNSKAKTELHSAGGEQKISTSISGLKRAYMDAQLALGMEYGLGRKISIGLMPNIHFALMPINNKTPVKSYQDFLSVETGIRVKL